MKITFGVPKASEQNVEAANGATPNKGVSGRQLNSISV